MSPQGRNRRKAVGGDTMARQQTRYHGDPAADGMAAARRDAFEAQQEHGRPMWLVTRPGPDSEMADVCWACNWVDLGHAFKGGLEGEEVYGLYYHEQQARNVAQSLLNVRDGKLDAAMVSA